jgi:Tfp pilus tip-associated adhesin PilY1
MKTLPRLVLSSLLAALPVVAAGGPTDLSETPISGASSLEIKPNILFILDDSYSMDWTYLPDWAGEIVYSSSNKWRPSSYQSYNAGFNGVAYNPEVRYLPPSYFDEDGQVNTTRYPSQTGTATGDWNQVPVDGYGIQSTDKVNLVGNAFYYQTVPGEYCADRSLRNCRNQNAPTEAFPEPATLRWCTSGAEAVKANPTGSSGALPACQAVFIDATGAKGGGSSTYMYPRMPAPRTARINFNGGVNSTTISSVNVDGEEILSEPATASSRMDLAKEVAKKIHACATRKVGACTRAGYDAEVLGANLYETVIYAPGDTSAKPVVVKSGPIAHAALAAFAAPNANVPGHVKLVPITESVDAYPKVPSRTDCAADNFCSYAEEMTNYANWHAYYRTRMQAMKTASSRSFEPIGDKYRIGYFSINNNTGLDFQDIADFGGRNKKNWYDKLFAARLTEGADTPLRKALSQAGWLFAGKYRALNGVAVTDPMQYYCQPNVAILSTDGYWNKDAGFTLDNKAVGDQDGPASGEPRPILDGGLGLRTKRTERWTKTIAPQDYTWLQKQEEEWVVDQAGYARSTKSQNRSRKGYLTQSKHEWRTDKWGLKKSVYTTHWWHSANSVTKWKTTTTYLRKLDYELQQQIVQREKRTNTDITFVMGQLQRLPKQLYKKVERDLYSNVKQVHRSDKQGTGYSDPYPVASCTDNANTKCTYDSGNNTWTKVDSCTAGGRGQVNPTSTTGDNRFTIYETKTSCGYRYSATVEAVPTATVNALPLLASCTRQGNKGSPYTEPHEVDCRTVSGAENAAENVAQCTVDNDYTCRFVWETEKQLWNAGKTTGDCVTYQGGGSATGSVWTNPGKICYFAEYTPWTAVPSCTAGTVSGVTTQCRDNPVVEADVTDANGWKGVDDCLQTANGQYDASGKRVNCQRKHLKTSDNVSSCTWTSTGRYQQGCEWYGQTAEQEVDTCTSSGGDNSVGGTWTGPLKSCAPVASTPTCVHKDGTWYYTDPQTGQMDTSKVCEYHWTGWSGFYAVGANGSCTPIGTNRRGNPQVGDTQCRYEAGANNTLYSQTVSCENSTNPPAPPSGWNNPATFPEGKPVPVPEYRTCYDRWTAPSTSGLPQRTRPDGSTEYYCTNDGVYSRCGYIYDSWGNVDTCTSVAASSGDGDWTVINPMECDTSFKVVDGFVRECTEMAGVTQCTPVTLEKQPITDPAFDPDAPGFVVNDGKDFYRKIVTKGWYAFDSSGKETTSAPTASEADPAPSNAGFCEVDPPAGALGVPGEKRTYGLTNGKVDKRKLTVCRATRPNQNAFVTDACPGNRGSDPNANTTDGQAPSADNGWVKIMCAVARTGPTTDYACGKTTVNGVTVMLNDIPATSSNNWTRTLCSPGHGDPTKDTLADVAEYYYVTDLRTEARGNCTGAPIVTPGGATATYDVCANTQGRQKMSTYTLGLGASGVMQFEEGYEDESMRGDFYSVWKGVVADPDKGVCSWQRPGTECNWPRPENNSQTNIDDLWHAAVNGRGTYFSAENPKAMATGISAALQNVTAKMGSLSAVTTAGPRLDVDAESAVFQVTFTAGPWTGDVQKFRLTQADGALQLEADWSAMAKLGATPYTSRTIFMFDADEAGKRKAFEWGNLSANQKKYFQKPHAASLSQLCEAGTTCVEQALQNDPNFGEKLVNFLRGDRSNEGETNELSKLFRSRTKDVRHSVLGDIVGSEAVYVRKPSWSYTDKGYAAFKAAQANRRAMLYVGANDGMLHAFYADDGLEGGDGKAGQEAWAFVPSILLPDLYRLADKGYTDRHRFFVDGTPVVGDVCAGSCGAGASDAAEWKTVLVGGLNRGGKGFYALDVTHPGDPKVLWEFTHANLGYSYGNPVITKLAGGTWVVLVTSGYNNISPPSGDGKGHLFMLNALTGALIGDISTDEGSSTDPSGLAKIAAWSTYPEYNNTAMGIYGGDLLGNVWRFDTDAKEVQRLATLKDAGGNRQPVTARPELGLVKSQKVVFVGTGRLLGASDTGTKTTQSLYAIKDGGSYGNPRLGAFVQQTLTAAGACPATNPHCLEEMPMVTATKNSVDWANQAGWYVDFPAGGERVNTSMRLMRGTLAVTTNKPQTGACVPAGISFIYFLDYRTGGYVEGTEGLAGFQLGHQLGTHGAFIQTEDGSVHGLVGQDCSGVNCIKLPDPPFEPSGSRARRISWRELSIGAD